MIARFYNSQQKLTKIWYFQKFSPKTQQFPGIPTGILGVSDSREFPTGNSQWPCNRPMSMWNLLLA